MSRKRIRPTTAGNLEAKFDAGEDVLDYFDLHAAKVVPPVKGMAGKPVTGSPAVSRHSLAQLKHALEIAAQIEKLGSELRSIVNTLPVESQKFVFQDSKGEIRLGKLGTKAKAKVR